jgi:O-acetylhomoserine/O-acetylserine sulfhydrylase-like pyridoxal-dependent enzyme
VPIHFPENTSLSYWVQAGRREYKKWKKGDKSWMTQALVTTLENIGFEWEVRKKGRRELGRINSKS